VAAAPPTPPRGPPRLGSIHHVRGRDHLARRGTGRSPRATPTSMAQAGCSKTEAVGDLLRRPPRLETPFDRPCKVTVASQLVLLRPTSAGMSRPMRPRCPVACHAAIAGDLTAERGRWPAETSRDKAQALFGHKSPRQLLAFLDAEASTRHLATTSWELCCCRPPRCCNDQLRAGRAYGPHRRDRQAGRLAPTHGPADRPPPGGPGHAANSAPRRARGCWLPSLLAPLGSEGFELLEREEPSLVVDDTVLVTGQRVTAFEPGAPGTRPSSPVRGGWTRSSSTIRHS